MKPSDLLEAAIEREKRGWVGLTDNEIDAIDGGVCGEREFYHKFAKAIAAKLKEKNNGYTPAPWVTNTGEQAPLCVEGKTIDLLIRADKFKSVFSMPQHIQFNRFIKDHKNTSWVNVIAYRIVDSHSCPTCGAAIAKATGETTCITSSKIKE